MNLLRKIVGSYRSSSDRNKLIKHNDNATTTGISDCGAPSSYSHTDSLFLVTKHPPTVQAQTCKDDIDSPDDGPLPWDPASLVLPERPKKPSLFRYKKSVKVLVEPLIQEVSDEDGPPPWAPDSLVLPERPAKQKRFSIPRKPLAVESADRLRSSSTCSSASRTSGRSDPSPLYPRLPTTPPNSPLPQTSRVPSDHPTVASPSFAPTFDMANLGPGRRSSGGRETRSMRRSRLRPTSEAEPRGAEENDPDEESTQSLRKRRRVEPARSPSPSRVIDLTADSPERHPTSNPVEPLGLSLDHGALPNDQDAPPPYEDVCNVTDAASSETLHTDDDYEDHHRVRSTSRDRQHLAQVDPGPFPSQHLYINSPSEERRRIEQEESDLLFAQQLQAEADLEADLLFEADFDLSIAHYLQEEEDEAHAAESSLACTRECAVCADATPISELPALIDCEHPPQTCPECYRTWIETQLNTNGWNEMKCPVPECGVILQYHDVQRYATPEVHQRYDQLSARSAFNDDPDFRWCAKCPSGQIHTTGVDGNIFRCIGCGHRMCVIHEGTWHEGETCEDYDYRVSGKKEEDQKKAEAASRKKIAESTKKCPGNNCPWNIEKNHGCDHMTCKRCKHEFCWICLAPYNDIRRVGNSAHKESCKYHSNRIT